MNCTGTNLIQFIKTFTFGHATKYVDGGGGIVRKGMCLLVKDGVVYGVRVDEGDLMITDMDLDYYIAQQIEPPLETLQPCSGMGLIAAPRPKPQERHTKRLANDK